MPRHKKPTTTKLAVFLASRLSTRTISLLLGESVDVVHKRKSRLKMRLKAIADNPILKFWRFLTRINACQEICECDSVSGFGI